MKGDDHDKNSADDIREKLDKKGQDRLRRLKESSRPVNAVTVRIAAVLREEQTAGCSRPHRHDTRSTSVVRKMKRSTRPTPNIDKVLLLSSLASH